MISTYSFCSIRSISMEHYITIGFALFLGTIFVGGAIVLSKILAFHTPGGKRKIQPYECSEDPIGDARIQFKVGYYIFALLFLVFDIESLFLFPCMIIFKPIVEGKITSLEPVTLYIELSAFILILFIGLIYAWKKGVLVWE